MSGEDDLFSMDPVAPQPRDRQWAPVAKTFRAFAPDQMPLMPPSLDEWLPEEHLARFVAELVDEVLDLGLILASYTEKRGSPADDPRLMVRLLIYGYTTGVRSSRAIERKCVDDVAFRYLAAGQGPDYRSISRFRSRHLDALAGLFTQSLHLAQKLGMVKMGRVALDGRRRGVHPGLQRPGRRGRRSPDHHRRRHHHEPPDALNFTMMLDQCVANTGTHPTQALLDAGYCSEANLQAADTRKQEHGTDTLMATGRLAHDERVSPAPRGRIPKDATLTERMARKLRTKPRRTAYAQRKAIVEPVFGQIMTCQNGRELPLRGENGARGEWRLLAACHNLRKIFRYTGTAGLAAARA